MPRDSVSILTRVRSRSPSSASRRVVQEGLRSLGVPLLPSVPRLLLLLPHSYLLRLAFIPLAQPRHHLSPSSDSPPPAARTFPPPHPSSPSPFLLHLCSTRSSRQPSHQLFTRTAPHQGPGSPTRRERGRRRRDQVAPLLQGHELGRRLPQAHPESVLPGHRASSRSLSLSRLAVVVVGRARADPSLSLLRSLSPSPSLSPACSPRRPTCPTLTKSSRVSSRRSRPSTRPCRPRTSRSLPPSTGARRGRSFARLGRLGGTGGQERSVQR